MKALLDTSVLVAGIERAHPMHSRALPWLQRARRREFEMVVSAHSLIETYAVLTTLPVRPRISPGEAWRLVHDNVERVARVVALTPREYASLARRMGDLGVSGGAVYDGIIAAAAQKAGVATLVTLDADLARVWPEGADRIRPP